MIAGKPRVVRRVGWSTCICCRRRMFSADISKIRICDPCKDVTSELTYDRMRESVPAKRRRRIQVISAIEPSGGYRRGDTPPSKNPGSLGIGQQRIDVLHRCDVTF